MNHESPEDLTKAISSQIDITGWPIEFVIS